MTVLTSGHGLTVLGLSLVSAGKPVTDPLGFTTDVSADGTTWSNPDVEVTQILSALREGDLVDEVHVGNNTITLYVRVSGTTTGHLNLGEKKLASILGRTGELVWQPPDPGEPPTVWDVLHVRIDPVFDGYMERIRHRSFVITLTTRPRPRSATKIATAAVTAVAPTQVDDGTSTSGWTAVGPTGATRSVVSGVLTLSYNGALSYGFFSGGELQRTGAISTSTNKYLGLDWKSSVGGVNINLAINGGALSLTEVRREPAPLSTYTRSWFRVPDSITSVADFRFFVSHAAASGTQTLGIDQVLIANALPVSGSVQQKYATIIPGGSVPTDGDVLVQHASSGLGTVVVFTHPAGGGYSPPLRPWLVSSDTVNTDSTMVSGFRNTLTGLSRFNIPIASVPQGDVHLWARLSISAGTVGAVDLNYAAWSLMGSTTVGDPQFGTTQVTFPALNTWVYAPIARLTLPTAQIGPAGYIYIDLQRNFTSSQTLVLDEAWLFAMDKGQLTIVDCGTGTPAIGTVHNRLRIKAPSIEAPNGRIEVATRADFADAFVPPQAKVLCDQRSHRFDPVNGSGVLTAANVDASTSFEHYPRWLFNAGTP